ncbi:MAG: outer membrane protein assembly factor BamD [Calditrichaeota bacterium]|nr:outer membrane protein assembly factor BamD [Calditrichota bacterium]
MVQKKYLFPLLMMVLVSGLVLNGCSKHPPLEEMDDETAFRYLNEKYEAGKYVDASEGFDFFTLNFSGSAYVDSAQYLLGMCHYKLKEYLLAADSFEELYRRFPRSKLVPDAMYMVGESYYKLSPKYQLDQSYTDKAIDNLQGFIDYYPEYTERVQKAQGLIDLCREKLAHKEYANGIIYLKMKDYTSAVIYFRLVIDMYYDTEWASLSVYQLGVSYMRDKQLEEAESTFRIFIAKYPEHHWLSKAQAALKELTDKRGE